MSELIKMAIDENGRFDMVLENGDFAVCDEENSVSVDIMERLLLTRVEALASPLVDTRANPLAGTNWYGTVLDSSQPRAAGELEIKRVILGTPGVLSISEWSASWPRGSKGEHSMSLRARIQTIYGEVSLSETVGV